MCVASLWASSAYTAEESSFNFFLVQFDEVALNV